MEPRTNESLLKKSVSCQVAKAQKEKDWNGQTCQITHDGSDGAHLVCFSGGHAAPAVIRTVEMFCSGLPLVMNLLVF